MIRLEGNLFGRLNHLAIDGIRLPERCRVEHLRFYSRTVSMSLGEIFSPPRLMTSLSRPEEQLGEVIELAGAEPRSRRLSWGSSRLSLAGRQIPLG